MFKGLVAAALAFGIAVPASADYLGRTQGWYINKNGPICTATSSYGDGTNLTIGISPTAAGRVMIVISNTGWGSLQTGLAYPVTVAIDGRNNDVPAYGTKDRETPGLSLSLPGALSAVAGHRLVFLYKGQQLFAHDISVRDEDAMHALWQCGQGGSDPFSR